MHLLSVNVALPRKITYAGKTVRTGIFKVPVSGRVWVHRCNLNGDGQADLTVHGGPHKAVYVYPYEHYAYWQGVLDRDDFSFGQFGENLTLTGFVEDQVHIGDVFRIGRALFEVSQPRSPCFKLGIRMQMPDFLKLFTASLRTGFYLRVLQEGELGAGDTIERIQVDPAQLTVRDLFRWRYIDKQDVNGTRQALRVQALAPTWKQAFAERWAEMGQPSAE